MHYIAIAHFPKDSKSLIDIAARRRSYRYPAAFTNVQSFLDVQAGRAIVHFETEDATAILRYTADWPEVTFDLFTDVPSETGWETYAANRTEATLQGTEQPRDQGAQV